MTEKPKNPFTPAKLGKVELKNRIMKAATFEGMTPDGLPGKKLSEFHQKITQGGVGLTTLSYCTTEADGRIMENMMWLHDGVADTLKTMISELQTYGTKVSGQVTHCGHFSQNKQLQRNQPPKGPSKMFVPIGLTAGRPIAPTMNQKDIDHLIDTYREAARFMKKVGFDAIEIHFGHGYGLSQFISPKTNRRKDHYGGSHENRMRLPLQILAVMREEVGADFPLIGKISMSDGVKGGIDEALGLRIAKSLDEAGIDALIPSIGSSSHNTMLMFRGDSIAKGMIAQQKSWLAKGLLKMAAPLLWKHYPYEPTYLLDIATKVKAAVDCPIIYIGGCSTRADLDRIFAAGLDFVQLARALLKDPAFVKHAQADPDYDSGCTHCNQCVALIQDPEGIRCVLNNSDDDVPSAAA